MANEVTKVTLLGNAGDPVEYTVADGTAIPKGTIMKYSSSPQTAAAADTDGDFVCGIASCEKKADDGVLKMACWTNGLFEITATAGTGSMVLGAGVKITGANTVAPADNDTIENSQENFGKAQETVAAGASGVVRVNI